MKKPIVVVGSVNIDLVVGAERIPKVGETVPGRTFNTYFGGKGANQAVGVAKLGYPVAMVGCVGADPFGEQLREGLTDAGVDSSYVSTIEGSSGVALITTTPHGDNNIVVVPGANQYLEPALLEKASSLLSRAGMLLTQLEIPLDTVDFLAQFAERNDIPLVLDPAPARDLPLSLLRRVSWITPNETEIEELLKRKLATIADYYAAAESLLSCGTKNVLLKTGARGALVAQQDGLREMVPAFPVDAVDTTAAGDAFNGGFSVGLMTGKGVVESVRFASAVAAISVTRHGAQPSLPNLQEVEQFIADYGSANSRSRSSSGERLVATNE